MKNMAVMASLLRKVKKNIKILILLVYVFTLCSCAQTVNPKYDIENIKVTSFSEEYPEFLEVCPLGEQEIICRISGGSENSLYYMKFSEGIGSKTFSLNHFDLETKKESQIVDYTDENRYIFIDQVIEIGDFVYFTEQRSNADNDFSFYSIKVMKDSEILELDTGMYPNSINSVQLKKVGDTIFYSAPDYQFVSDEDEALGNGTYGYKVGKIQGLDVEILKNYTVPMEDFKVATDTVSFKRILYDNSNIDDTYMVQLNQGDDEIYEFYDETGVTKTVRLSEMTGNGDDLRLLMYGSEYLLFKENVPEGTNNLVLFDTENNISTAESDVEVQYYITSINDRIGFMYNYGYIEDEGFVATHYLLQVQNDGIAFKEIDLPKDRENYLGATVLSENRIVLSNYSTGSNDVYLVDLE